ncbi:hypothetical protein BB559_000228 [Furculomyces boomerangus]|uniref:Uncharacterized protein n=1 Tax=Furculomyces boomerangus TaxID=61424 RepID=A0A2T9Z643_9FUNG|nr:hypothetical protein BB559_000228 [Furculomyces boomerangus]
MIVLGKGSLRFSTFSKPTSLSLNFLNFKHQNALDKNLKYIHLATRGKIYGTKLYNYESRFQVLENLRQSGYNFNIARTFRNLKKIVGSQTIPNEQKPELYTDIETKKSVFSLWKSKPEITIYNRGTRPTKFRWTILLAFGQLIIWINLADISWSHMVDEDESGNEELASPIKRGLISCGLLLFGSFITVSILLYTTRCLHKAKIINYGRDIQFERFSFFGKNKISEIPVASLYSRSLLVTGNGERGLSDGLNHQWILSSKTGGGLGFIFDRRGEFYKPNSLDTIFYRENRPH